MTPSSSSDAMSSLLGGATKTTTTNTDTAETAFPLKLHIVLDESERHGFDDVISWQGDKAFAVHKPRKFEESIMKEYFNQTQYRSFQRQRKCSEKKQSTEQAMIKNITVQRNTTVRYEVMFRL